MQYANPYIERCLEGESSVFRKLNPEAKELINGHHSVILYKKGAQVVKGKGAKTRGLIYLVSGSLKIFRIGVGGRKQTIKLVRESGLTGLSNLVTGISHTFSIAALEDSVVCFLEKGTLLKIMKNDSDLTFRLLKAVSEENLFLSNRIISLTQKHIRGRIAESLLLIKDNFGIEADGKTLKASFSRDDIANLSNMTTSNAIRTLSDLSAESIIEMNGKRIMILDQSKLEKISESG